MLHDLLSPCVSAVLLQEQRWGMPIDPQSPFVSSGCLWAQCWDTPHGLQCPVGTDIPLLEDMLRDLTDVCSFCCQDLTRAQDASIHCVFYHLGVVPAIGLDLHDTQTISNAGNKMHQEIRCGKDKHLLLAL